MLFRTDENAWKSLRNLGERVQIVMPEELNTYDVLLNDWLVFSQPALETTIARLSSVDRRRVRRMSKDPRDIIIKPVVSEKSYAGYDLNVYTFIVAQNANKIEIRTAVEQLFARRVEKVHTINRKAKRTRNRSTGAYNAPARQKRAIVTLAAGEERIDIFGS